MTYLDETLVAARELSRASRWPRALSLLDAAFGTVTGAASDLALDAPSDASSDAALDAAAGPASNVDLDAIVSPASNVALDATVSLAPDAAAGPAPGAAVSAASDAARDAARGAATDDRARIALAAAEVALDSDWFAETALAAARLTTADRLCAPSWDLDFLHLRHDYRAQLHASGTAEFGPAGKDPAALEHLRDQAGSLADRAPDRLRHGWARMYLGLILDNLFADPEAAPFHYAAALEAGDARPIPEARETGQARAVRADCAKGDDLPAREGRATRDDLPAHEGRATRDDLLAREALRHLGAHDRDRGDLATARARWERATFLGARAGLVAGTLSQQLLLAVLSLETNDEPGARRLAAEIARWSSAIGAPGLESQAESLLAADPVG
ncbi:hypothetical protein [Actinoplanes sp. NPDC051411]|uniref:hypothetical protein n=1 Tax=Actinoplanes sp. NPDC051411 TaxID=3155522 RepID=UPI0034288E32